MGHQTVYLQNIQLQSCDNDICSFCKFFLNIESVINHDKSDGVV